MKKKVSTSNMSQERSETRLETRLLDDNLTSICMKIKSRNDVIRGSQTLNFRCAYHTIVFPEGHASQS